MWHKYCCKNITTQKKQPIVYLAYLYMISLAESEETLNIAQACFNNYN